MQDDYIIHKAGRGWYRPDAQGYTTNKGEAGRYSRATAERHTHPNGPDGPRDGLTYEPAPLLDTRADPVLAAAQAEVARFKTAMIVASAEIEAHKAEVARLNAEVDQLRAYTSDEIETLQRAMERGVWAIPQNLVDMTKTEVVADARAALVQP